MYVVQQLGAYNVGRLGAAIAPATIGYLATGGSIGLGFLVMGAAYFICGLLLHCSSKKNSTILKNLNRFRKSLLGGFFIINSQLSI